MDKILRLVELNKQIVKASAKMKELRQIAVENPTIENWNAFEVANKRYLELLKEYDKELLK